MSRMVPHLTFCEVHGKKAFTKPNAKKVIRLLAEPGMRRYPCGEIFNGWHVGHLPWAVRVGLVTMDEASMLMAQRHAEAA